MKSLRKSAILSGAAVIGSILALGALPPPVLAASPSPDAEFSIGTAAFLSDGRLVTVEIIREADQVLLVVFRHANALESVLQHPPNPRQRRPPLKAWVQSYAGSRDNVVLVENDHVVSATGFTQSYPALSKALKTRPILADLLRELKSNRREGTAAAR